VDENDQNVYSDEDECNIRRFSIDPQITDLSTLQSIIVRAFNSKRDFNLTYYRRDVNSFVSLQNDWDLDAAYLSSSHPFLQIRMSVDKQTALPDWDIITVADVTKAAQMAATQTHQLANTFLTRMEKIVTKAFTNKNRSSVNEVSNNSPLTEKQYYNYLDGEGRINSMRELRISVFRRGVEPNLRKAVWKHLLNVYPFGLSGQQRIDYIKAKSETYFKLRDVWKSHQNDPAVESIYSMVKKDVLRTDRTHQFFSGTGEDNKNVTSLLNILTTFALNHKAKYCQGMSDLASPLLYAMKDESHAYICFCALMKRLCENFRSDGEAMSRKFQLLSQLVQYYDSEFFSYLKQNNAHELLFCYRWILLELKREFAFDDAMHMLEVLWSSIPPLVISDLLLVDEEYRFIPGESKHCTLLRGNFDSLSINSSSLETTYSDSQEEEEAANGKIYANSSDAGHHQENHELISPTFDLENSVKLTSLDQLLNSSSGHGSLTATLSSVNAEKTTKMNGTQRPVRTIRFLPKILSNDSKEIDSPEADDYNKQYYFPPKFIDKQFSVDDEEKPRLKSFDSVGSVESVDSNNHNTESASEKNLASSKTRAMLFRQRSTQDDNSMDVEEFIVHCNGEYVDKFIPTAASTDWQIPRGLARSESNDSLKDNDYAMKSANLVQEQEKGSDGYASASTSENHFGLNGNKSLSSSCSSLLILSSTGSIVDGVCSSKLRITLPSPSELGSNNAFMLFLCLTLLLQHRETIIAKRMDANEIAMYFDGLVRKHNVNSVLETARHLFHSYLSQWHQSSLEDEFNNLYTNNSVNGNSINNDSKAATKVDER
ncbi:TBC1 domain family member 25-like protein, partial [Dinothrombium tinctorium]